jgi:hypothetical protein
MKKEASMAKLKDVNLLAFGNTIHLAGAVYLGEGKVYLAMLPQYGGHLEAAAHGPDAALFFDAKSEEEHGVGTLDLTPEDWKTFLRQTDLMETEIIEAAGEDGKLAKAIVRKSQRQISQDVSWKVYRRDGFKCRYCGADDCPLTVDHLVLWEDGGPTEVANLVAACKRCNNKRGNTQYREWLQDPYYLRVSQNLPADVRRGNEEIAETLDAIPRLKHKRKSR